MNKKIALLSAALLLTACISFTKDSNSSSDQLSHAEKILIDLYRERDAENKQNSQEMLKAAKENHKLTTSQSLVLKDYEKSLHKLETELKNSVKKFDVNISKTDGIIESQKELLKKYSKSNTLSWCAVSAITSSAITVLAIEAIKKEISIPGLFNRFVAKPTSNAFASCRNFTKNMIGGKSDPA